MKPKPSTPLIPSEHIEHSILLVRGQKVMLDSELAALYQVETKRLNEAVQRNLSRFPEDFMFQFTDQEFAVLKSQFATSNKADKYVTRLRFQIGTSSGRGGTRKLPYAFTEQGIAMLSSVLRSERAVQVNIEIMRAFVNMRRVVNSQAIIKRDIALLKNQFKHHDEKIQAIFLMIDDIVSKPVPVPKKRKIGFVRNLDE